MAKEKEEKQDVEPSSQIAKYLKANKEDHYNFEDDIFYRVSSGSLLLDIELGGGIGPGVHRFSGSQECGKSSAALSFLKNFLETVDNSIGVYFKSEGRLSQEMKERSGVKFTTDPDEIKDGICFVYESNIYESCISLMRDLVVNNPLKKKYFFILDSIDAMQLKDDSVKEFGEAQKVSGGALLSSVFLKRLSLGLSKRGHICILISQVRDLVSLNPYEKKPVRMTNASGGNAISHFANFGLEFQPKFRSDLITTEPNSKGEILGSFAKVIFRKSTNEKTNKEVRYPICYGRKNGTSIWVEYEIIDLLLMFNLITAKGAWITVGDDLINELKENNLNIEKQHQGNENLRKYLTENKEITEYLIKKFKNILIANK